MSVREKSGFAIALAWPEMYCKQAGAWYDGILHFFRISKHHYFKVGHAAVVLVDREQQQFHYFDFGRYHTPFRRGRVRSALTDHDLRIRTAFRDTTRQAREESFHQVLEELQQNTSCHGEGALHASYCRVDFGRAFEQASKMQARPHWLYGPFHLGGTNCSRFVKTVILAGRPGWQHRWRLKYMMPLTPMPKTNVSALRGKKVIPQLAGERLSRPVKRSRQFLKTTLAAPPRAAGIPSSAQWLSGEGAGSWFVLSPKKHTLQVTRYSPSGVVECTGMFSSKAVVASELKGAQITYPSTCAYITVQLDGRRIRLMRKKLSSYE